MTGTARDEHDGVQQSRSATAFDYALI